MSLLFNIIYLETGVVLTTLVVFETKVVTFKNVVTDDVLFGVVTNCDVERVCDVVEYGVTREAVKSLGPTVNKRDESVPKLELKNKFMLETILFYAI